MFHSVALNRTDISLDAPNLHKEIENIKNTKTNLQMEVWFQTFAYIFSQSLLNMLNSAELHLSHVAYVKIKEISFLNSEIFLLNA